MSATTNVVQKLKQLFYNAGTNSADVDSAVDEIVNHYIYIRLPNCADGAAVAAAADDALSIAAPMDAQIIGANFSTQMAMTNTAGDTITVTVYANAVSCATFNSDSLAATAAANGTVAFTVNAANGFVDAGEAIVVAYTLEDNTNNYLDGTLTLVLKPQ